MRKSNVKKVRSIIVIGAIVLSSLTVGSIINTDAYAAVTIPKHVKAISIKDQYIRINWDTAFEEYNTNIQYEVYVIEGGRREYVGTTIDTGFVFTNLKGNTDYEFFVRGLDQRDATVPDIVYVSNKVRTGNFAGTIDKDKQLGYRTKAEKSGHTANVIIGSDTLNINNKRLNYNLDLTREELAGSKDVVISIPADVVLTKSEKLIKIIGSDYTLSFSPNVFESATLKSNSQRSDAGVRFKVSPVKKSLILKNAIDKSADVISQKYVLEAQTFVGNMSENMDSVNGTMNLVLDYDLLRTNSRRLKTINLVHYNSFDKVYTRIANGEGGTALGELTELGTYLTIGTRR